jgi:hypothetical protein
VAVTETSFVRLPPGIRPPFDVYLNGVPQRQGADYDVNGDMLRFPRRLVHDKVSGWRWLIGAFGIGTYRQDDSVDIRYERDGRSLVAQLPFESGGG